MKIEDIGLNIEEKSKPIIILDSGLGGLHVLEELSVKYPIENFVLFYDNEFLPYGTKNEKILGRRISKIIKHVKRMNPKAIVLACNTLDALTFDKFEGSFPSIPIFGVVNDSAKKALDVSKSKNIALLATKNTVMSKKYMYAMFEQKNVNLYGVECPELATAIEEEKNIDQVLDREIKPIEKIDFDTIILGCTHYYYVKSKIQKKYPNINIVDSSEVLVESIIEKFPENLQNRAEKQKVYIIITKEDNLISENITKKLSEKCILINENI